MKNDLSNIGTAHATTLPESVRIPLHSLQADLEYLIGRVIADGSCGTMIVKSIRDRLDQIEVWFRDNASKWICAARKQTLPEPAECNWPICGCDPYADKVIAALEPHKVVRATATAADCTCSRAGFHGSCHNCDATSGPIKYWRDQAEAAEADLERFRAQPQEVPNYKVCFFDTLKMLHEALDVIEAIDSECLIPGHLKDLADAALVYRNATSALPRPQSGAAE